LENSPSIRAALELLTDKDESPAQPARAIHIRLSGRPILTR
jgi:hypothetical protein